MKIAQIYKLALTQFLVFLLAFSPMAALAREYGDYQRQNVPQKYIDYFSRNDQKMKALETLYMSNNCSQSSTTTCQQVRGAVEEYATKNYFPVLRNIPGAIETLKNNSNFRPQVNQHYVNNIKNEITENSISITQYKAEMEASFHCRKEAECEVSYKKSAENLAKATNRKANATKILNDYLATGLVGTDEEAVVVSSASASDVGDAKASDFINKTNQTAVSETTKKAGETFAATSTSVMVKREGSLDPEKMDITTKEGFAGQIVMTAIGTVGRGIMLCTNAMTQSEVIVYAAGAAIYIAGEIMGFQEFKKAQKDLKEALEVLKKEKGGQKEALYKMLQAYQTMKKTSEKKKQMQTAAATAFFTASAIAATKYGLLVASRSACVASCSAAQAMACATCPKCPMCPPCSAAAGAAGTRAGFLMSNDLAAVISATKYSTTLAKEAAAMSVISTCPGCSSCQTSFGKEQQSWVMCPGAPSVAMNLQMDQWTKSVAASFAVKKIPQPQALKKVALKSPEYSPEDFVKGVLNLIIPQAKAFGGPLLGIGGVALNMLSALVFTEWRVFDLWIHGPLGRSIVFALTGSFAIMQAKKTGEIISELENRIALVTRILAQLEAEEASLTLSHNIAGIPNMTGYPNTSTLTSILAKIPNPPPPFPHAIPCMMPNGEKVKTGKCGSFSTVLKEQNFDSKNVGSSSEISSSSFNSKLSNFGSSSFNSSVYTSASVADSIQGSDRISDATMEQVNSLADKLSLSQKALKESQDLINDHVAKAGKKPVNFEAYNAMAETALQKAVLTEARKNGLTLEGASKEFSGQIASLDQASLAKTGVQDDKSNSKSMSDAANALSSVDLNGYQNPKFDIDSKASSTTENADLTAGGQLSEADALAKAAKEGEELKLQNAFSKNAPDKEEIIDKPEYNLFKIISVRYLKSGYKRLGFGVTTKPVETKPAVKK